MNNQKTCFESASQIWEQLRIEAEIQSHQEPLLSGFLTTAVLQHTSLISSLSAVLSMRLATHFFSAETLRVLMFDYFQRYPNVICDIVSDYNAMCMRDPAVNDCLTPYLYFKGFHALCSYRVMHLLWQENRYTLALFLQSQISLCFAVDVHPAAKIGHGIMFDHATGIVVGETVVIENDVSLLQGVTLGGTGKESGDRHPKIREGVMIGAGAKVLGNIEIGRCAKIGSGAVVLNSIPPHSTAVGIPARVIGEIKGENPAFDMNQHFD